MNGTGLSKGQQLGIAGLAGVVILVGGYFAAAALSGDPTAEKLASGDAQTVMDGLMEMDPDKLASDESNALKRKAMETLRDAPLEDVFGRMQSDDLTDEQRKKLRENMRRLIQERMESNLDEYTTATEDQKVVVLDRHIDEWMEFQEKMRAYREAQREKEGDKEGEREGERERRNWQAPSREERETQMANSSPEQRARQMQYGMKLMARAQERGVSMWGGGRGGRGPGGRGPRGG